MTAAESNGQPRFDIAPGGLAADLFIPAGLRREAITVSICRSLLQEAGVEVTPQVQQALEQIAAAPPVGDKEQRLTIAVAVSPTAGSDGAVHWLVSNPPSQPPTDSDPDDDFFRRAAAPLVRLGQVIGRITAPMPGAPGRDVTDKPIRASMGKPVNIKLAGGVLRDGRDQLIAQVDGSLVRSDTTVTVRQRLDVLEPIGPVSGDVRFKGDVIARQGVLDRGLVHCGGDLDSAGVIAAANIECGGDLLARIGVSGHRAGSLKVGGTLIAKYLGNIDGSVAGDVLVQREIINADLIIGGGLCVRSGTIHVGNLSVTGAVEVGVLGCDTGTPTHLILGTVPFVESKHRRLDDILKKLSVQRDTLIGELEIIRRRPRPTAMDKERLTEIMFNLKPINKNISLATEGLATLERCIDDRRGVNLVVTRMLHRGTRLSIRDTEYLIGDDLVGPVHISMGKAGDLLCR